MVQYYNPYFLLSTCFGLGKAPFMPGTIGSLAAFPITYYCLKLIALLKDHFTTALEPIVFSITLLLIMILVLFIVGIISAAKYSKLIGQSDPKEIVIDEIVGQMLTSTLTVPFAAMLLQKLLPVNLVIIFGIVTSFILFRLFDIFKPWPIGWLDKNIKGGLGIMLDDIAAAIFAIVIYNAALLMLVQHLLQK